ncbi:unnamed protein product [[Candida] boidinii]|nr:unnamed protein product [[Candida] boidinii]
MVVDELKKEFANVESKDEIAKYKDADKIRYNPTNDLINNSTNSVRRRNEEAQVEINKGNENDQTEMREKMNLKFQWLKF